MAVSLLHMKLLCKLVHVSPLVDVEPVSPSVMLEGLASTPSHGFHEFIICGENANVANNLER